MNPKIAIIYYSSTGNVYKLAKAMAEGAESEGAEVRLRRAAELAPDEVIQKNTAWWEHHLMEEKSVPVATHADLEWAQGIALGTPTRFGNVSSQLKQFIDTTGGLWAQGKLNNKVATSFTSSLNRHGGQESTILSLNNIFYHWGCIIVPPGYTDPQVFKSGGNPYGTSYYDNLPADQLESVLETARFQGKRLARFTRKIHSED